MRQNNIKSNIWQITLQPGTNIDVLLKIQYIDYFSVKWEFLKKQSVLQCKRCQRFNHSANNCTLPYRCVKCLNEHEPYKCPINELNNAVKPRCVNCKGEHPANNAKKCPIFQKQIEISNSKKSNEKSAEQIASKYPTKKPATHTTSSNTTKPKTNASNRTASANNSSDKNNEISEIIKMMSENTKAMQNMVNSVVSMQRDMMNIFSKQNAK